MSNSEIDVMTAKDISKKMTPTPMTASTANSPSNFMLFLQLPTELKLTIWEISLEEPRYYIGAQKHETCIAMINNIASAIVDRSLISCCHERKCPTVFMDRQLSMNEDGEDYDEVLEFSKRFAPAWFDPETDFILLSYGEVLRAECPTTLLKNTAFHVDGANVVLHDESVQSARLRDGTPQVVRGSRLLSLSYSYLDLHVALRQAGYRFINQNWGPFTFFLPSSLRCHDEILGHGPLDVELHIDNLAEQFCALPDISLRVFYYGGSA
ncbi:hypothetical protein Micbo1qcDRAFT_177808 [Microdochium bolleyi]|uniref:2EXR domain-containing protein n=1 Tax=Microdochium bolleyi TaxID=196109 RepID=A0A136IV30_9PEZI|nr:hypothetical protein Micbo1qcDRAFT_177808 [Microdochium bolleyi]